MLTHNGRIRLLFAFSIVLCLARFIDLDSAPFINDEPQLQLILDLHLRNHTLPLVGLLGTHGVHYGPTALWFYLPIRLLTAHVNTIIAYYAAIMIAGYAILVAAVWKSAGKEVAAWVAAFIAASPYLFFYSRLPWDNTFLIPLIAVLCLSVVRIDRETDRFSWVALGAAGGLIVNLHLMALPVLVAAIATLLPTLIRRLRSPGASRNSVIQGLLIAGLVFSVTVVPYLAQVRHEISSGGRFDLMLPYLGDWFDFTPRFFSWTGMEYFLEGPRGFHRIFQWDPSDLLRIAGWAFLPVTIWWMIRRNRSVSTIQRMAVFSFIFLMLYYGGLQLDTSHPHYILPIWWVMIFLGSLAIVQTRGLLRLALGIAGALTLVMNTVFIVASHAWIDENHGTRGIHYGPVHVELEDVVAGICRDIASRHPSSGGQIPIWFDRGEVIGIYPYSVQYYVLHNPDCAGRVIPFYSNQGVSGMEHFRLTYKDSNGLSAALLWKRL